MHRLEHYAVRLRRSQRRPYVIARQGITAAIVLLVVFVLVVFVLVGLHI
jgi:hypothetical protein